LYGATQPAPPSTVLSGPTYTVAFTPIGYTASVRFPSLNVLCKLWKDTLYLIAVNSTDEPLTAQISNLPVTVASATLPFESRSVQITGGVFLDTFLPWSVHIYKIPISVRQQ
jgi:hypothetical protein